MEEKTKLSNEKKESWFDRHLTGGIILILFGVFFILWIILGVLFDTGSSNNYSSVQVKNTETISFRLNAPELINEYESNGIAADQKYADKIILVSGQIASIDKDLFGSPYVALREDYEFNSVQCMFKGENQLVRLAKGEFITLKGRVSGYTLGSVIVRDCSVYTNG